MLSLQDLPQAQRLNRMGKFLYAGGTLAFWAVFWIIALIEFFRFTFLSLSLSLFAPFSLSLSLSLTLSFSLSLSLFLPLSIYRKENMCLLMTHSVRYEKKTFFLDHLTSISTEAPSSFLVLEMAWYLYYLVVQYTLRTCQENM